MRQEAAAVVVVVVNVVTYTAVVVSGADVERCPWRCYLLIQMMVIVILAYVLFLYM